MAKCKKCNEIVDINSLDDNGVCNECNLSLKKKENKKIIGTVKWFSKEKGYGFITNEDNEDFYFNIKSIIGAELPNNSDTVEFEAKKAKKGMRAIDIKIVKKAENNRQDDRINCPACGKKIVPRMITYRGEPEKSVCPYCGSTVKVFSKCFIATAVYNDASCYEVRALRDFRDSYLQTNFLGRVFVKGYYKVSPPIAKSIKNKPLLIKFVKRSLDILVFLITFKNK